MYPDLVGATGFETASHQRDGPTEAGDRFHVSDRSHTKTWLLGAAAESVATVFHQVTVVRYPVLGQVTIDQGEIDSLDGVGTKQRGQMALGKPCSSEHHQPRGFLVDSVHDEQWCVGRCAALTMEQYSYAIDQGSSLAWFVRDGADARWLVHNH